MIKLDAAAILPADGTAGTLIGRAWVPGKIPGPSVVRLDGDSVLDLGRAAPTVAELCNAEDPVGIVRGAKATRIGSLADMIANSAAGAIDPAKPYFLAPVDLQAVKASGVTFVSSMLERLVEEQAKGDPARVEEIRKTIHGEIGTSLERLKPGSPEAAKLKEALIRRGAWSQYLEVGIGPDAEIFTKCPPMAAVGLGAEIGIHPKSIWNNPEPEIVMVASAKGRMVGAALGNDVNLRDVEGRSALLLGKAKDNNASCAIGPFLRLFDASFGLDDLRQTVVELRVEGLDQFVLEGASSVAKISRDLHDLVAQTIGANHQYPDGVCLFSGTMFSPTKDRGKPGEGFTHKLGDIVTIRSARLGSLVNRVTHSDKAPPWTFGAVALMRNLAERGLLG
ncbi:MAG: fumarylacetoacetate hydrolase family protein [Proteobacteria bacterium]|nr:fumarylacetoacetate hydrolase family protein [Pseudomonadota bacterium]MBI3499319.1 fumarylacetoacetate hydrolase family protein [Pseudomonadota bacterium]